MANVNSYTVTGRIVKPVQVSRTGTGVSVCNALVSIPGNSMIEVAAFGSTADILARVMVGQQVLVSGPVVSNEWTARDGVKRQKLTVRAEAVGLVTGVGGAA